MADRTDHKPHAPLAAVVAPAVIVAPPLTPAGWLASISLSTMIQVIVLIFSSGMVYSALKGGQEELQRSLLRQSVELQEVKNNYLRADLQVQKEALLIERLVDLKTRMERIEKKIDGR